MKICLSVFGHIAFSAKQWNLSENSRSQIAIRLEDVTESVKATDVEAFTKEGTSSQIVPSSFLANKFLTAVELIQALKS